MKIPGRKDQCNLTPRKIDHVGFAVILRNGSFAPDSLEKRLPTKLVALHLRPELLPLGHAAEPLQLVLG